MMQFLTVMALLMLPFLTFEDAYGDENGTPFFDIGNFKMTEGWEIEGTYLPSGLEGCNISVYSNNKHVMNIVYKSDRVDVYLKIFDDTLLKTMLKRGVIERESLLKISFSGPQIFFTYNNCSVELHDATIRFLRIQSPGKIVFSNLTGHNITKTSGTVATLRKGDFCGMIIGSKDLAVNDGEVVVNGEAMFRGITLQSNEPHAKEILTIEDALKCGSLGGEITIVKEGNKVDWISTSYYNNVTIELMNDTMTDKKAEFIVSGDEHTAGKTIKINVGKGAISSKDLKVKFDGEEIPMADNITDVLNPNDDGLQPEYVLVNIEGGKGNEFFLLISVPHFSKHIITLQSLSENPLFSAIAIASAFTVLAVASWALFKK